MKWWPPRKLNLPKVENGGVKHSAEVLRESEQKLRDAVRDRNEVKKVSQETTRLKVNDLFAEALEQAMRRSHG